MNFADIQQRHGAYLGGPRPPYVPGLEAAGIAESVGASVRTIRPGTRVVALAPRGMHAEYAVAEANATYPLPDEIPSHDAVAVPVHYPTAYHALTTVAHAQSGETVLVHAAAGGLGTALVQVARILGLKVVGTCSTEEKRRRVEALGADLVTGYERFEEEVRRFTGGRGCEIVVDSVGGSILQRSLTLVPPLGRVVVLGIASKERQQIDSMKLLYRSQSVLGFHFNTLVQRHEMLRDTVGMVLQWMQERKVAVQIGHTLPLSEIRTAHSLIEERRNFGKVVLTL